MGVTTAMCNSFKQELLGGIHDLDTHTIKLALIKASPTENYGAATTTYDGSSGGNGTSLTQGTNDEATGTNYSAGGQNLDSASISLSGSTAIVDFADEVFSNVTTSADGCLIYNSSASNKAIAVISFGGTVSATAGDLTIEFPPTGGGSPDSSNAVIRIA
tara:strand:+ start:608 stop:1087 length:480 start_codon:yes stop_codon:yes gene_type:complete